RAHRCLHVPVPRPPGGPLVPYTTLFRSSADAEAESAKPEAPKATPADILGLKVTEVAEAARGKLDTKGGVQVAEVAGPAAAAGLDRKSTGLNSSHVKISDAVFCLKYKKR